MKYWHIHTVDWFAQLPADVQARLERQALVRSLAKGEMIFEPTPQPDRVFILRDGLCRIYSVSDQGEEFTLDFVTPGEVFGELAVLDDMPQTHFAQAFEPSRILQLGRKVFLDLMEAVQPFSVSVSKQVAGRLVSIQSRAEDLVFRSAASRLARTLLSLDEVYGHDCPTGRCLSLRFTQAEIGTLIGTSRPTASLLINAFKTTGVLAHRGGHLVLTDLAGLQKLADTPATRAPA